MVYIITQTKGKLADDAQAVREAVRNDDRQTAVDLLIKHNGFQKNHLGELLHNTPDGYPELHYTDRDGIQRIDPWLLYNADTAISRKIQLTDREYSNAVKGYNYWNESYAKAIVRKLKQKFPTCDWRIDYEY
jgi:hypothetical protein